MKRFVRVLVLLIALAITSVGLFACDKTAEFTVIFDSQGGSEVASQKVKDGKVAVKPKNPTKEGFEFGYWYLVEGSEYDFQTPVTSNITLKALWDGGEYTVTFDTDGGSSIAPVVVAANGKVTKPEDPTKDGFKFNFWTKDGAEFSFDTPITGNITLKANWTELSVADQIEEDYQAVLANFVVSSVQVNTPTKGPIHGSRITWNSTTPYVSNSGIVLPLLHGQDPTPVTLSATFRIGTERVKKDFDVELKPAAPVVLTNSREVQFSNKTTEYTIPDGVLELWFEENGTVPYVNPEKFLKLVEGFVDPAFLSIMEFTYEAGALTIYYPYYDEEEDYTYHLTAVIDSVKNTITTPDPGFYWAYVYSTETNYSRNITYPDNADASRETTGLDLVYHLGDYNLQIVNKDGQILMPFNLVNQLFAGSSYYNVFYNGDALVGIYALPDEGTDEYDAMMDTSLRGTSFSPDLVVNNFNSLAFYMDNFYGLKEYYGITTFYDLLMEKASIFLSTDPKVFDGALGQLIYKTIDELHTSYGYPSYYSEKGVSGYTITKIGDFGPKVGGWYQNSLWATQDVISAKWGSTADKPGYWFLNEAKTHAVITLNSFKTKDIYESATFDNTLVQNIMEDTTLSLPAATGTKFFFYNSGTQENKILEIVIRGVAETYFNDYKALLEAAGFTYVFEPSGASPVGYFKKTFGEIEYMVVAKYDAEYQVFYIGVADELPASYSQEWLVTGDVSALINGDSAVYMEFTLDKMFAESPSLTHVTLDVSYNTGGNVGALYRIVGFVTSEPFRATRITANTGSKSSSYIQIENVPNYGPIKWSLLVSNVTFSAGNSVATIFKENNLGPIIGLRTGGGTSSVTPILLPNGTAFTMSSNSMNGIRTGSGTDADPYIYTNNEAGIVPDYLIDLENLYDEATILEILNQHIWS